MYHDGVCRFCGLDLRIRIVRRSVGSTHSPLSVISIMLTKLYVVGGMTAMGVVQDLGRLGVKCCCFCVAVGSCCGCRRAVMYLVVLAASDLILRRI